MQVKADFARAGRGAESVQCEFRRLIFCNVVGGDKHVRRATVEVNAVRTQSGILPVGCWL